MEPPRPNPDATAASREQRSPAPELRVRTGGPEEPADVRTEPPSPVPVRSPVASSRDQGTAAAPAPDYETPEYLRGVVREPLKGGAHEAIHTRKSEAEYEEINDAGVMSGIRRVRANPDHAGAWVDLGNAYARAHRPKEAVKMYRRAVALDSGLSAAWNNMCGVYLSQYEEEQALAACERAVSVDPYNAWAHYNTGIALDRLDRVREALDHYQLALTLDPSLKSARVNPNIVNNRHLEVLKLRLYRDAGGSLSLPLQPGTGAGAR